MISPYPHLIDLTIILFLVETGGRRESRSESPGDHAGACSNKIMATLFYEPSTRTQMSFQTAMLRLGVWAADRSVSITRQTRPSPRENETSDTTKIVSGYADILVMRHPVAGAAKAAALSADRPVINAGDSGHLHPTQTLTDLLTLKCEKGQTGSSTIGLCGDLINGKNGTLSAESNVLL